jgi:ribosomal protein L3
MVRRRLKDILENRTPRKKGQKAKSKKHSDLYTDEDPKGTIKGLGFKDAATAKKGVGIINKANRKHAHKVQATLVMKQRAKVAKERTKDPEKKKKLSAAYKIWSDKLEQLKKKTKSMKEADLHSKLSRGHKPDWYQLHSPEFKPFDKSRDDVEENFADGKKPGRKGISKRVGIPKGATLTQLAKLAKAKGEKGRMARWQLNMRRGKKKKSK